MSSGVVDSSSGVTAAAAAAAGPLRHAVSTAGTVAVSVGSDPCADYLFPKSAVMRRDSRGKFVVRAAGHKYKTFQQYISAHHYSGVKSGEAFDEGVGALQRQQTLRALCRCFLVVGGPVHAADARTQVGTAT